MTKINISKIFFTDIEGFRKMVFIITKCQIGFSKIDISISVKCIFTDFIVAFADIDFQYQ